MLSFSQSDIFSQLLHNWHYTNVYSISATYTYSTVYNYSPMYTGFAVYICFPFHNVIFFLNYCIIYSTTVFTAYPQHMHTVLFTITLPSRLTLLFTYASFSQYDIFSQLLPNWLYNNVYSIFATYTYSTVCNYSPQYTGFSVYICFPFHNVIFFHNYRTIHSTKMSIHILNIYIQYCLQLHNPVYCMCFLHMLSFHNVIFFHNHCTIDSTTMSIAYPQHIHTVLFTITLPSTLALLFIYAFLFTMWYFSSITA